MYIPHFYLGYSGHPLYMKFCRIIDYLHTSAIDMDHNIKGMCNDLREKFETTRDENEAEIQLFGIKQDKPPPLFFPGISVDVDSPEFEQRKQERDLYYKKLEQQINELTEAEREQLKLLEDEIEDFEFQLNSLIENYPQLLFKSLFMAVYSHFERYLIDLCNAVRESESLSLKPKDLGDKGIRRSQAYLKKVAGLNFPANTKEWQVIKLVTEIRNKLVHNPEHDFRQDEVDPKLLDYFWLDDPSWDDFDVQSEDFMFSLGSIKNLANTFVRFSTDIDKAWEENNNLRKKFQQGPKHKK